MEVKKVKLSDLVPDPKNTRIHDERNIALIKRSLERFGQYRAFVVQTEGNIIRVGNGMYQAMKELGWEEGHALYKDLSDEEATALSIVDNRSSDLSFFDDEVMKDVIHSLDEESRLFTGFDEDELQRYFVEDVDWDDILSDTADEAAAHKKADYDNVDLHQSFMYFENQTQRNAFYYFLNELKHKYNKPLIAENFLAFIDECLDKI